MLLYNAIGVKQPKLSENMEDIWGAKIQNGLFFLQTSQKARYTGV
jgi:hypothetical protein